MTVLSTGTLGSLDGDVQVPTYDRGAATVGIVHVGVGGFHRAHEAMYVDRLMEQGEALDWGICGVGVLPGDRRMRDVLTAQDGLYTLVQKFPDGHVEARVVGSILEFLLAPDDPEAVVEKMATPETRIVSMTVTEGGYNFHAVTGEFDLTHPDVAHDLEAGATPRTTFGLVTAALRRRRERGTPPFTVMSCDNIQGNGHAARRSFVSFARAADAELGDWIDEHVSFPNSMVDRITPVTTDEDRALVASTFGIEDGWPVVCEPFTQWALEDDFSDGRPPFEDAGVEVVPDVEPYELMKLRLLNASHQALGYLGYLMGYRYAHDAAQNAEFAAFVRAYMDEEATPTLKPLPGVDLDAYKTELIERFSNPAVADTLARLCADSSDRIPKWVLPVIRWNLENEGPVERATTVVAAWARYAEGVDEQGEPIEVVDQRSDTLVPLAHRQSDEPLAFVENRDVFGDLVDDERFRDAYRAALASLHQKGARETMLAAAG